MLFAQPSTTCKSVLEPLPCKKFGSLTGSNFPCAAWPAILGIKHTLVSPSQLCIPMGRSKYTEGSASSLDAPFASSCVLLLRVQGQALCVDMDAFCICAVYVRPFQDQSAMHQWLTEACLAMQPRKQWMYLGD